MNMSHANSLRVIGQLLEVAKVERSFELEKLGNRYLVWSASLTKEGEVILRNALQDNDFGSQKNRPAIPNVFCFNPADILRLDALAQKRRGDQSSSTIPPSIMLSHQLRSLGDHLDRIEVNAFHIMWADTSFILGTNRFMETGAIELLQLKSCGSGICTESCYGPTASLLPRLHSLTL
jgi:hypothetical protein